MITVEGVATWGGEWGGDVESGVARGSGADRPTASSNRRRGSMPRQACGRSCTARTGTQCRAAIAMSSNSPTGRRRRSDDADRSSLDHDDVLHVQVVVAHDEPAGVRRERRQVGGLPHRARRRDEAPDAACRSRCADVPDGARCPRHAPQVRPTPTPAGSASSGAGTPTTDGTLTGPTGQHSEGARRSRVALPSGQAERIES